MKRLNRTALFMGQERKEPPSPLQATKAESRHAQGQWEFSDQKAGSGPNLNRNLNLKLSRPEKEIRIRIKSKKSHRCARCPQSQHAIRARLDSGPATGYFSHMRQAFKEWVIVVDALLRGEQILIFRKGGLREGRGGFQIEHPEFWLFPTLFHQQRDAVIPAAQARFDELAPGFPAAGILRLEGFARVVAWRRLDDLAVARRLKGRHIWRDEVIAERFDWGGSKQIHALAVRVFRLPKAVELPMLPSYGGCKSWIELEAEIDTTDARPALDDTAFSARLEEFQSALVPVANAAAVP
jgi:hypothetical protein